ncbi:MAG TPA: hypothetical protein VM677_09045 [Actinokineospora sp.]|jgi:hypothetical protein|nr:hypothetical protein [Actinokineospora sp.]
MTGEDFTSWRTTGTERRRAFMSVVQAASTFAGPFGPLVAWGFEYVYDRRDLIFNRSGTPLRAYTAEGTALGLAALGTPGVLQLGTLSLNPELTQQARSLGLRDGDPVSVVITGHKFVQGRSGLVVPARIGTPLTVSVPRGDYTVSALGSKRDSLFTTGDPYTAMAGADLSVGRTTEATLSLRSRRLILPATETPGPNAHFVNPAFAQLQHLAPNRFVNPKYKHEFGGPIARPTPRSSTCTWCGTALAPADRFRHILTCASRPDPAPQPRTQAPPETLWDRVLRFIDEF